MTNRKREQKPKPRNQAFNQAMQEKGRSSAASPHRNRAKFNKADRNSWKRDI